MLRNKEPGLFARARREPEGTVAISTISLAELRHGTEYSSDPAANSEKLSQFTVPLTIEPFGADAAHAYGMVRTQLGRRGNTIGAMDMLIAAHAIALNAVLITRNTREFGRVTGLRIESWSSK